MATSVHQFKAKNIAKTSLYLRLTMFGGIVFLILKSTEYYLKLEGGYHMGYDTFFSYYWLLTGFHVIHIIVGLVILLFMYLAIKKTKRETEIVDLKASAAFWHSVI
jgi:nitric oxide reductase NorE protein